jgi:cell division protein FtsQ
MRWQHNDTVYDVARDGRILAAAPNASLASPSASVAGTDVVTATAPISPTSSVAPVPRVISGNSVVVIDTTPDRVLEPGSYVDPDALEVARRVALRAAELPTPLEQIRWEQNIGVVLQVGGRTVVVGNSERLDEKLAILVKVLREQTPFTLLDLRPSAPYLR